jgi:hypothetical protein
VSTIQRAVYQLHISLKGIDPPIWRRVQVWGDTKLPRVHKIFQALFNWQDYHLHQFKTARHVYRQPDPEDDILGMKVEDESVVQINHLLPHVGDELDYIYDFGDNWRHRVVLEAILLPEPDAVYPRCIGGERNGPPEDAGGTRTYMESLRRRPANHDTQLFSIDAINGWFQKTFHRKKTATR